MKKFLSVLLGGAMLFGILGVASPNQVHAGPPPLYPPLYPLKKRVHKQFIAQERSPEERRAVTKVDETTVCTICLGPIMSGDPVVNTKCGHPFHRDCVGPWLIGHHTCPNCRGPVESADTVPLEELGFCRIACAALVQPRLEAYLRAHNLAFEKSAPYNCQNGAAISASHANARFEFLLSGMRERKLNTESVLRMLKESGGFDGEIAYSETRGPSIHLRFAQRSDARRILCQPRHCAQVEAFLKGWPDVKIEKKGPFNVETGLSCPVADPAAVFQYTPTGVLVEALSYAEWRDSLSSPYYGFTAIEAWSEPLGDGILLTPTR